MSSIGSQDAYIKACKFAAQFHQGQTVPGTDWPYIIHPTMVCMEIMTALSVEPMSDADLAIQCALLHDVMEDTPATYEQVQQEFGSPVADGVRALSKAPTVAKALQMEDSLRRIRQQPHAVWMVKLADRITNLQPPPAHWTAQKIQAYAAEALLIVDTLKESSSLLATRLLAKHTIYLTYVSSR